MKLLLAISIFLASTLANALPTVVESWGGTGIGLMVLSDGSAQIQFDCGSGSVPANRWLAGQSRNKAVGTMTPHTGVRPPPGYQPRQLKATYSATTNVPAGKMSLTVKITGQGPAQIYRLSLGAEPVLRRCM